MPPLRRFIRLAPALLVLLGTSIAHAQEPAPELTPTPIASSNSIMNSEVPQVPGISGLLRGFNAGLTLSGLHDAATGWATLAQPAVSFSFTDIFSLDVTIPIYMYRLAESQARKPKANAQLVNQRAEVGDMIFGLHSQFFPRNLQYQVTLSATAPTGDQHYGLTSGRATFDLTSRFEHSFARVTPMVELGIGDSSTLINRLVVKNYTTLGPLSHFQVGAALPLVRAISFEADVYEQLPIGDQKIYRSVTRHRSTSTVVAGRGVTEDNGFITSLDLPMDGHATLSAYYSRSLRQHDDVVSIGLTYVLRAPKIEAPTEEELSGTTSWPTAATLASRPATFYSPEE